MLLACHKAFAFLLVASFAVVAAPRTASAEPRVATERRDLRSQLAEERQRLRETEQRIQRLEAQLKSEEQAVRLLDPPEAKRCTLPFFLDTSGLKHLRAECMNAGDDSISCASPFELREDGSKRFRMECSTDLVASSANPTF